MHSALRWVLPYARWGAPVLFAAANHRLIPPERAPRLHANLHAAAILLRAAKQVETLVGSADMHEDANRERMQAAIARQSELNWKLADAEQRWLSIREELDALEART